MVVTNLAGLMKTSPATPKPNHHRHNGGGKDARNSKDHRADHYRHPANRVFRRELADLAVGTEGSVAGFKV